MGSIVVCGGSVIGLSVAMMLADDGHRVTVLERDPAPPPDGTDAVWTGWERPGVPQFHQPHNLFARARHVLDAELPGIVDRLTEAGCVWIDPLEVVPPPLEGQPRRPDDDRFRFITGRRPVVESVFARAATEHPGVDVRRGVAVGGLLAGTPTIGGVPHVPHVPHVTGVRTADGEELPADLVVDATGRRTRLADWLQAIGARPPHIESEDSGFVYHTRYFGGVRAPRQIGPPVSEIGTISLLTLPGDNGTWSVTVWAASADTALRPLRDVECWTRVVRACPWQKHWVRGRAITGVLTMAGVLDRYRRFVVDGTPVATGVAAVGDAWACTNPSAGRGITVGLMHAQGLRGVVRRHLHDPGALVRAWDEVTEAEVAPYYWDQISADRRRIATMDALREGRPPPPPDPLGTAVGAALAQDPDVFRAALEIAMCMARPPEVFSRPGLMDKITTAAGRGSPMQVPGPDRATLMQILSGSGKIGRLG